MNKTQGLGIPKQEAFRYLSFTQVIYCIKEHMPRHEKSAFTTFRLWAQAFERWLVFKNAE